ncbi:type II toxin-antitoxin system HicA family toxin [bacterium]|nr:type II toxin-antitoxin system HicA family toxin [bacterium]MCI0555933.1 type II toxin-antitoxin system HicA family toxin [Anaerolineae bacterium]MCI0604151.1 type II toxin-antitoxin system HicA family toxin [bacterium]
MSTHKRVLDQVLRGTADSNIRFADLCSMLKKLKFQERIKGSHHIFTKDGVEEIINLQPKRNKAKPYQVKQVRNIVLKYKLGDVIGD